MATGPERIAVLGAGGFIGSHLVPALVARPGVTVDAVDVTFDKLAPDLERVKRIRASIADPAVLGEIVAAADVVVSLTALCNPALYNTQPIEVIDANYTDLVPLVKLCAERRRWLIHLSTCEVYGRQALDEAGRPMRRMDEDKTALALGPIHRERWTYAAAKQLLERQIWAYGRHRGLKFTLVRPFNVIGPRMDFIPGVDGEGIPRVLASFLHALMAGQDLLLVGGLNLGNDANDVTIRELARALSVAYRAQRPGAPAPRLRSVTPQAFYGAGYDDSVVRIPSIAKARRLLGWRPRVRLDEMLPGIAADYLARYEDRVAAAGAGGVQTGRRSAR